MKKNKLKMKKVWWQKVMNENEKKMNNKWRKNDIQIYPTKWHENTDDNENEKNEKKMFDGLRV